MKLYILVSLLLLFTSVLAQQSTTISFLVEYEDQQQEDYIELGLIVSAQGTQLVEVMAEARNTADEIKKIATEFCQAHSKKKNQCKDVVEIDNYAIEPNYQTVKRQKKFEGFTVSHKVAIKVLAVDEISDLADIILKEPNTKISTFEWKPLNEVDKSQMAVSQGQQQASELCDELGMHYGKTIKTDEVKEASTEDIAVFQFEVECFPGKKSKKQLKPEPKEGKKGDKKEEAKAVKEAKKEIKKQEKKETKKDEKQVKKPAQQKKAQKSAEL